MVLNDKLVAEDGRVLRRSATFNSQARNLEAFQEKLFSLLKIKMTLLMRAKDS
jgi:hypothetical protein